MNRMTKWLAAAGAVELAGSLVALAPRGADRTDSAMAANGVWKIRATGARIIGGYGDNFAYNGENVRALNGSATMTVDLEKGTARLEIDVETTQASGPIRPDFPYHDRLPPGKRAPHRRSGTAET